MLCRNEEKGFAIIGEAALHLALAMKKIDVIPLIVELESMIEAESSDERVTKIVWARNWLLQFTVSHRKDFHITYLEILKGLNE